MLSQLASDYQQTALFPLHKVGYVHNSANEKKNDGALLDGALLEKGLNTFTAGYII